MGKDWKKVAQAEHARIRTIEDPDERMDEEKKLRCSGRALSESFATNGKNGKTGKSDLSSRLH